VSHSGLVHLLWVQNIGRSNRSTPTIPFRVYILMAIYPPAASVSSVKASSLHPYHIVDPSPWPLVTAFAAFFLVFGLSLYRHAYTLGFTLFAFGLVATTFHASL
jgi:hypothetical protein